MERISCIISHLSVAKHQRSMVDTHRHAGPFCLECTDHVYQTRVEMARLLEVTVGKHLADTGMDEMCAPGILAGQCRDIVVRSAT